MIDVVLAPLAADFASYEHFVNATTLRETTAVPWQDTHAGLLTEEVHEFLFDHGTGPLVLLPPGFVPEPPKAIFNQQRFAMAAELGDVLWFTSRVASCLESNLGELATHALQEYAGQLNKPIQTFTQLETAVAAEASRVKIPNKLQLAYGITDPNAGFTRLSDNPGYLLIRSAGRLRRSLNQGLSDLSPPTATELEPVQETAASLGLLLVTIAYVANTRLKIPLEDIARFNMLKLMHRQLFGKHYDLTFGEMCVAEDVDHKSRSGIM